MVDFANIMNSAYRGLFSLCLGAKMQGAIKDWPRPELEAQIYEKRFRFLKDAYRFVSYENYQNQKESFLAQFETADSCMKEAKNCFTNATKKLQ